jgi:hypothetical protein
LNSGKTVSGNSPLIRQIVSQQRFPKLCVGGSTPSRATVVHLQQDPPDVPGVYCSLSLKFETGCFESYTVDE